MSVFESIGLTKDEELALQRYRALEYKIINSLLSEGMGMETSYFISQTECLPQGETKFKKIIDVILNIYSAMIKYTKQNITVQESLYRGTSTDSFGILSNSFLSFTKSERSAVTFCGDKKRDSRRIFEIRGIENIPFFDMSILPEQSEYLSEEEILLCPFLTLDVSDDSYRNSTYVPYPIHIVSPYIQKSESITQESLSEDELCDLYSEYYSCITSYFREFDRYKQLENKVHLKNQNVLAEYEKVEDSLNDQYKQLQELAYNFKNAFKTYIIAKFLDIERELGYSFYGRVYSRKNNY